jgi:hypothetical protein
VRVRDILYVHASACLIGRIYISGVMFVMQHEGLGVRLRLVARGSETNVKLERVRILP